MLFLLRKVSYRREKIGYIVDLQPFLARDPSRGGRSNVGQPWVELVEGGDYGRPRPPSQDGSDGTGPRCGCHGKVTLLPSFPIARWEIALFHIYPFIREV